MRHLVIKTIRQLLSRADELMPLGLVDKDRIGCELSNLRPITTAQRKAPRPY